ncbi:MAG: PEP-CTERM sorting domain-containing protein [Pseudomonadota bacterium]
MLRKLTLAGRLSGWAAVLLAAGLFIAQPDSAYAAIIDVNPGNVGDSVISPSYDVTDELIDAIGQPVGGQSFDVDFMFTDDKTLTSGGQAGFTWSLVLTYSDLGPEVPPDALVSLLDGDGNSIANGVGNTFLPGGNAVTYSGAFNFGQSTFSGVSFSFVATDFGGAPPLLDARFSASADLPFAIGQRQIGVPEPSSAALFGLGLMGILGGVASRRRAVRTARPR